MKTDIRRVKIARRINAFDYSPAGRGLGMFPHLEGEIYNIINNHKN